MNQISDCPMEQARGEFCWYHPSGQLGNCLVTCGAICTFYMIFLGGGVGNSRGQTLWETS